MYLKNFSETRPLQCMTSNGPPVASTLELQMKKKALAISGIAAATLLAGGWAMAQPAGHGPGGFGPGGMHGMHGQMGAGMHGQMGPGMRGQMGPGTHRGPGLTQFDPARIETLKTELGITAAQEPAWTKYAKTVQDSAATMQTTREGIDRDAVSKMTPADRFAFVTKMREQGQKQFEAVQTAANELLTTLDDAQKAKARDTLPGLASSGPGNTRNAMRGPHRQH
jgi:hypothetical protein